METPPIEAGHGLARLLVDRGLIAADDVVDGALVLRDLSRRNANVLVERRGRPSFFLKAAHGPEGRRALRREADRYRSLARGGVAGLAPRLMDEEAADGVLVLEGLANARDLRVVHMQEGRFPVEIGALVGDALGVLHEATIQPAEVGSRDGFPSAFALHRPTVDALRELHPSSLDLARLIQGAPEIGRELDRLRDAWGPTATVHNDLKWDNVLLVRPAAGEPPTLRIVDWEHARDGEPLWDVGSAIASYLSFWIYSIEVRPGVPPEALPDHARFPLERMAPALAALWSAYGARRGWNDPAGQRAAHATRLAGARLLLFAHEATESGASVGAHLVLHVQLAANLLSSPGDALASLGLAPPAPA